MVQGSAEVVSLGLDHRPPGVAVPVKHRFGALGRRATGIPGGQTEPAAQCSPGLLGGGGAKPSSRELKGGRYPIKPGTGGPARRIGRWVDGEVGSCPVAKRGQTFGWGRRSPPPD